MAKHSGNFNRKSRRASEAGQTTVFFVLVLGIFLLGALCFAFDLSNMWFHRQAAQGAADAACAAGAMDLLVNATNGGTQGGLTAGNCTTTSSDSACSYARMNGYKSDGAGNVVSVSFPGSVIGVTTPPAGVAATPFIRVDITDHVQTFFAGLFAGRRTADVRAFSTCGVALASAPIPILVLDPQTADGNTLAFNGTGKTAIKISIYGGPQRSVQVNSGLANDISFKGNAGIDLSQGGPGSPPTGSDLGVYGSDPDPGSPNFIAGTTSHWISPAAPINDPFAQLCAPGQSSNCTQTINGYSVPKIPTTVTIPTNLTGTTKCNTAANIQAGNCTVPGIGAAYPSGYDGCPATAPATCTLYTAGAYPGGIAIGPGSASIAIFDPGLYYVSPGSKATLLLDSGSTVRPGTGADSGAGDGSGGTTFYFVGGSSKSPSVSVDANSGKSTYADFLTSTLPCPGSATVPANLPSKLQGNILIAPCSGYYGDPLGTTVTPGHAGETRNMLFFQDRSATGANGNWGGGGQFLLAGTMYFHACIGASPAVGGEGCTQTASTKDSLDSMSLSGNSASGTYILGDIVIDQLTLGGTSGINMDLNPTSAFTILKASIFQ